MEKGGVERPQPSRVLLPPAPQAGASASSATTAFHRLADYSRAPRELRGSLKRSRGSVSDEPTIRSWQPDSRAHGTADPSEWRLWNFTCDSSLRRLNPTRS